MGTDAEAPLGAVVKAFCGSVQVVGSELLKRQVSAEDLWQLRDEIVHISQTSNQGRERQVAKAVLASLPEHIETYNDLPAVKNLLCSAQFYLKSLLGNELEELIDKLEKNMTSGVFPDFDWSGFIKVKTVYGQLENPKPLLPQFDQIAMCVTAQRGLLQKQLTAVQVEFSGWVQRFAESRIVILKKFDELLETCKCLIGDVEASQKEGSVEKRIPQALLLLDTLWEFQKILAEESSKLRESATAMPLQLIAVRRQLDKVNEEIDNVQKSIEGFRRAVLTQQVSIRQAMCKDLLSAVKVLELRRPSWWQAAHALISMNPADEGPGNLTDVQKVIEELGSQIEEWRAKLVRAMKRAWEGYKKKVQAAARKAHITVEGGVPGFGEVPPGLEFFTAKELCLFKKNTLNFLALAEAYKKYDELEAVARGKTARGWIARQIAETVHFKFHQKTVEAGSDLPVIHVVFSPQDLAGSSDLLQRIVSALNVDEKVLDYTALTRRVNALRAACRRVAGAQGLVARIDAALAALLRPTELKSPISVQALIAEFSRRLEDLDGEINTIERDLTP